MSRKLVFELIDVLGAFSDTTPCAGLDAVPAGRSSLVRNLWSLGDLEVGGRLRIPIES